MANEFEMRLIGAACDLLADLIRADDRPMDDPACAKLAREIVDWCDPDDLTTAQADAVLHFALEVQ